MVRAVVGAAGSRGQKRKKLFLNCEQKGRKNERKKEREEKCK